VPSIKLLKRAEIELTEACKWYEKQQKGLSRRLRAAVKNSLNSIVLYPFTFSKRFDTELRYAELYKFPYVIVYWFDENLDTIFVTSIFHTKRDPKKFEKE
jgi:mRNA-degrading endonuclease RelE of RelBE toxin-antitoxin system